MSGPSNSSQGQPGVPRGDSTSSSLLERLKGHDQSAWHVLNLLYRPMVRYWCRKGGIHKHHDVEDVTQEVLFTVGRKIAAFTREHTGGFRGWLRGITRNKVKEHFKRSGKEPEGIGGPDDPIKDVSERSDGSSGEEDTEIVILVRSVLELLRGQFEPHTFEAARRVLTGEQDPAEVACELSIKVATVHTAKYRVRKRFRQRWDELCREGVIEEGLWPPDPGSA